MDVHYEEWHKNYQESNIMLPIDQPSSTNAQAGGIAGAPHSTVDEDEIDIVNDLDRSALSSWRYGSDIKDIDLKVTAALHLKAS